MRNPEFIELKVFPEYEKLVDRTHSEFHQAARATDVNKIIYAQGRFDGVQMFIELLGGLKMSETKRPADPGLMGRILGFGKEKVNG